MASAELEGFVLTVVLHKQHNQQITAYTLAANADVLATMSVGAWSELPAEQAQQVVTVLFPTRWCVLTRVKLPKVSRAERTQAAAYALEDQLTEDVENLYFVLGEVDSAGWQNVAVIAKSLWQAELAALAEAGIQPAVMLPDCLALAYQADTWSLASDGEMMLCRTGYQQGFAVNAENVADLLSSADDRLSATTVNFYYQQANEPSPELGDLTVNRINCQDEKQSIFDFAHVLPAPALNFLQGKYRSKRKAKQPKTQTGSYWKWVIYSVLGFVGVLLVSQAVQYFLYQHKADQLNAQAKAIYQRILPASPYVNPQQRVNARLTELQKSAQADRFLRLLGEAGKILQQYPTINLRTLSFTNQTLRFELAAPSLQLLERFSRALSAAGLQVQQSQLAPGVKQTRATLIIRGAGI